MRWKRSVSIIVLLFITTFIFSGCWDYKETEKLDVVIGIAIDKEDFTNEYIITGEIASPSTGERQSKYQSKIYSAKGKSILEATRNFIPQTGRRTFWSNSNILILSKKIVEKDISKVLEWLYRESEIRGDLMTLVSNKSTAREILEKGQNPDTIRSIEIAYALNNNKHIGTYPKTQLSKLVDNLKSKESTVLIPLIDLINEEKKVGFQVMGSAILQQKKVIGYLKPEETQAALLLRNDIKHAVMVIDDSDNGGGNITIILYNPKIQIKPIDKNGELELNITLKSSIDLNEITIDVDLTKKEEEENIRKQCENALKKQLNNIINLSKNQYKADIFDFYYKIEAKTPSYIKKIKSGWEETYLQSKINIDVNLDIRSTKLIINPIRGGMKP
ncbi:germination protein, Ger(x)C family [Clostridium amylolyticum]|uniref:Germination protein, Ger(X)C family n=2 Tax=Clostridium amylolyticum TaxID=1121298 RepID=A0A1M6F5V4_9CLOT|nr:germination protein, Ger(x)C family [Clostridium amylolyticum]